MIYYAADPQAVLGPLAAAGRIVVSAFANLLSAFRDDVFGKILDPVIRWIKSAFGGYDSRVSAALNATVSDVVNGGTYNGVVTLSDAGRLLDAIGGNVMDFGLVLGAALTALAVVLACLSSGAEFPAEFVLSGLGLAGAVGAVGMLLPASFTSTAVDAADHFTTSYLGSASTEQAPQAVWTALSEGVGDGLDLAALPLDIYIGVKIVESKNPAAKMLYPAISVALDMSAISLDAIAWAAPHSLALAFTAAVVAGVGLAIGLLTPDVVAFAGFVASLIAGVSLAFALADAAIDCTTQC